MTRLLTVSVLAIFAFVYVWVAAITVKGTGWRVFYILGAGGLAVLAYLNWLEGV